MFDPMVEALCQRVGWVHSYRRFRCRSDCAKVSNPTLSAGTIHGRASLNGMSLQKFHSRGFSIELERSNQASLPTTNNLFPKIGIRHWLDQREAIKGATIILLNRECK